LAKFNYKENNSWGNIGWLGSDAYYTFWGDLFARKLAGYFQHKTILDIGAGTGRVWDEAFRLGLEPKELHLIDPALNISRDLSAKPEITAYKTTIDNVQGLHGDVAVFKQSIHHVYDAIGLDLFDAVQCPLFINFSMPLDTEWPLSPALMEKYKPSVLDVESIVKQSSKIIKSTFAVSYPVKIKRDDWCLMLKQRFISTLHDCDDCFLEKEILWVEKNQPDILEFNDTIECTIFLKR
jgi:hypothetical protein